METHHRRHSARRLRRDLGDTEVDHLGPLAVSSEDDLGVRAVVGRLLGQRGEGGRAAFVTTLQVTQDRGGIVDALHGHVVRPHPHVHGVEERWARDLADVAEFDRATGIDDRDGFALVEFVSGETQVELAFVEIRLGPAGPFHYLRERWIGHG